MNRDCKKVQIVFFRKTNVHSSEITGWISIIKDSFDNFLYVEGYLLKVNILLSIFSAMDPSKFCFCRGSSEKHFGLWILLRNADNSIVSRNV